MTYNKTQLNPDRTFNRHVFHRDQFAHYLRWTHVLKCLRRGMNVLDVGCGSANLLEVIYRNRYKANKYVGLDVRSKTISTNSLRYTNIPWASFKVKDMCQATESSAIWDIITCFEVVEHVGKKNAENMLNNILLSMSDNTILLLSTPCYDPSVGAADNHMIDGEVGEFTFNEFKQLILKLGFEIINVWGTFASQKDYKEDVMDSPYENFFIKLHEYYDSNVLSNIMAPFFPEHSRNCLWKLKKKEVMEKQNGKENN